MFWELQKFRFSNNFNFYLNLTQKYKENSFLIFGNEGSGLPEDFYKQFQEDLYTIPMPGIHARSLNLANSVAIVLYEGLKVWFF